MLAWLITIGFLLIVFGLAKRDIIWAVAFLWFLVFSYLSRLEIWGIPTTALELGIYVVAWVYVWKLVRGELEFKWRNEYWLAIIWLMVGIFSAVVVSNDKISSLGLWKGWFVDPVLVFVLVVNNLKYKGQVELLRLGSVFLIGSLGAIALMQYCLNAGLTVDGRVSGLFQSANYLAMLLWPNLLLVLSYFIYTKKYSWWEVVFWLMGLGALLLSMSYVGVGSLVLGIVVLFVLKYSVQYKYWLYGLLGVIVVAGGFLWGQIGTERFDSMIDLTQRSSITVRLEVWQISWEMLLDNVWQGVGLGNYEEKYLEYAPKAFDPPMEWRMLHAHNWWLHTWIELSIFGFLALLMIIYWWVNIFYSLYKKEKEDWLLIGLMVVVIGWFVSGVLDTPYYKNDLSFMFWLFFGITVVKYYLSGKKLLNTKK
ncbi:O-antigen ligase family protein [Patescibacteria group bacterium]|nr:O-antigen ligase family protein [Patescibacteria group bacterium]